MARGLAFAALAGLFAGSAHAVNFNEAALFSKASRGFWLVSGIQQPTAEMTCTPPAEGSSATVSLTVNGAVSRLGPKPTTIEIARALLFGTTTEYAFTSEAGYDTTSGQASRSSESSANWDYSPSGFSDEMMAYTEDDQYPTLKNWEISTTSTDSTSEADYVARGLYRLWDLLTPLALHASVRKVQVPLRPSVLAGVLINAECTLNDEPLVDLNTPLDAAFEECVSPEYIVSSSSTTDTSGSDNVISSTSTTDSSDKVYMTTVGSNVTRTEADFTARSLCTAKLVCNNLPINTHVNGYGQNWANYDGTAYLIFGGYACPTGYLVKCDATANHMVANTDGSGCVAAPGWAWADMNGNNLDITGVQSAYMCNPVGTQLAAPSAQDGSCQCLNGYTGLTCELCTDGFLSTKVLIGDGVHSLTALAELYTGVEQPFVGSADSAEGNDYGLYLPGAFSDYSNGNDYKYTPGNPGSFCVRDPNA